MYRRPMKTRLINLFLLLLLAAGCRDNKVFEYDPNKPYPELKPGNYWPDKFDRRGLQNGISKGNLLFVNTINLGRGKDYLYALDTETKKVAWRNEVETYAAQPVGFSGDQLFYVTYVGHAHSFTLDGKKVWARRLETDCARHSVNAINGNLLVESMMDGSIEIDRKTGITIRHSRDDAEIKKAGQSQP